MIQNQLDNIVSESHSSVGIIANPNSGKDIRRLVASASVVSNQTKANEIVKLYSGLISEGIQKVIVMPDFSDITRKAREKFDGQIQTEILKTSVLDHEETTVQSAIEMEKRKLGCVVIFGGDGTCRLAARFLKNTPILPVSTGTNNLFPMQIEGTVAGIAAGRFSNLNDKKDFYITEQILDVFLNDKYCDSALVDVVSSDIPYVGSKAIWDIKNIHEIFISKLRSTGIGFSSIGFRLYNSEDLNNQGVYINLQKSLINKKPTKITAPIAPGKIEEISVSTWKLFNLSDSNAVKLKKGTIALDGERSIEFGSSDRVSVKLNSEGPKSLLVEKILSI
jgi:hypothetical protein